MKRVSALLLSLCLLLGGVYAAGAGQTEEFSTLLLAESEPPPVTIYGYSEGLAQAESGGKWGFANVSGELVIPARYDSVVSFSLGMAAVNLGGRLGVIRTNGSYLIVPEYDSLVPVDCGLYIVQKGDKWGVVSILPFTGENGRRTREVYPITYASAEVGTSGGLDALILTAEGGARTVVPLFRLPGILSSLGVGGSQFPLTRGRLPAFEDVTGRDWFSLWVDIAYNTGIMSGTGGGAFEPQRALSVAEVLQMAANMDSRYRSDSFHTTAHVSNPWYSDAVNYCLASGIITPGQFDDYTREITRRELAQVFSATDLAWSLPNRNNLSKVRAAVGDVDGEDPAAEAIYSLYGKGIFTGVDENCSFHPDATVTRAEAAALAARLARPEQRVDLFL